MGQTKGNVRNKFWKSVALLLAVPSQMTIWTNQSVLFQRSHVKLKNYDIAFWAKDQSTDKVAKDHLRPHKRSNEMSFKTINDFDSYKTWLTGVGTWR